MKTRQLPLQQYAFLNKYLEGDNESFFEIISPQIGFVVIDFNLLEERMTSFLCHRYRANPFAWFLKFSQIHSAHIKFLSFWYR